MKNVLDLFVFQAYFLLKKKKNKEYKELKKNNFPTYKYYTKTMINESIN